jgi:predicted acetyltransferase
MRKANRVSIPGIKKVIKGTRKKFVSSVITNNKKAIRFYKELLEVFNYKWSKV